MKQKNTSNNESQLIVTEYFLLEYGVQNASVCFLFLFFQKNTPSCAHRPSSILTKQPSEKNIIIFTTRTFVTWDSFHFSTASFRLSLSTMERHRRVDRNTNKSSIRRRVPKIRVHLRTESTYQVQYSNVHNRKENSCKPDDKTGTSTKTNHSRCHLPCVSSSRNSCFIF